MRTERAVTAPEQHQGLPGAGAVPAVEASGLKKRFGTATALDGVDLVVAAGSVCALLGPNGAGKTTTVRVLSTLLRPDEGEARVFGHDAVKEAATVRRLVSLTGQLASLDEDLSGWENLVLAGRLLGFGRRQAKIRAEELLDVFGLGGHGSRQLKTYSGGMRRRLDLAASLLAVPKLLFLDEPTAGLDPASRAQVWAMVRAAVAAGTTVLLTTQYLEEADQLADRVTVIDRGKVVANGTPAELKASVGSGVLQVRLARDNQRADAQAVLARALGVTASGRPHSPGLSARLQDANRSSSPAEQAAAAVMALAGAGIAVAEFSLGQPSLDEVFLALTGHGSQSGPAVNDRTKGEVA